VWRNSLVNKAKELEQRNNSVNVAPVKTDAWPSYETPKYINTPSFQEFLDVNQVHLNEGTGYMFMRLEKDHPLIESEVVYHGGETVKGSLFFELFHPSVQHEIFLRMRGVLIQPKVEENYSIHSEHPKIIQIEDFKGY
jgi:hypothetical protein